MDNRGCYAKLGCRSPKGWCSGGCRRRDRPSSASRLRVGLRLNRRVLSQAATCLRLEHLRRPRDDPEVTGIGCALAFGDLLAVQLVTRDDYSATGVGANARLTRSR